MAKVKVKVVKNKYKELWDKIHKRFEKNTKRPLKSVKKKQVDNNLFSDGRFSPVALADSIKNEVEPLVFVGGCFYHYTEIGIWQELSEHELGKLASEKLGRNARAFYIEETIKLLSFNVSKKADEFKSTLGFINLKNGMLNIVTEKLEIHSPNFNSRSQLPYDYDTTAECPRWKEFLKQIFADDPDKAKTLQQWFGYCLTPYTFLQKFLIAKGSGANGKGTALHILSSLVGQENCCAISLMQMEKDSMLGTLKDKLVNICGEIRTSNLIDTDRLKILTGEDPITVDQKYKNAITFTPTAKHIFSVNELPKFADKTEAFRRRAIFLPFLQTFKGKNKDPYLKEKLSKELAGILLWALEGLRELLNIKQIFESNSCLEHKARFFEMLNPVLAFINQACELCDEQNRIQRADFYKEYRWWHISNVGDYPLSKPSFFERLRDDFPQIAEGRINGVDYFKGIKVKQSFRPRVKVR
jgi:putative DNA primase/helicase